MNIKISFFYVGKHSEYYISQKMNTQNLTIKIPPSTTQKPKPKGRPKKSPETKTPISDAPQEVKSHLSTCLLQLKMIENLCTEIYKRLEFGGKEHHYQAALEDELRDRGFHVQQEVARLLHYQKLNNEVIQLPHDIRGREDIVLHKRYLIIELKQTGKLSDKEFNQICRYMDERKRFTNWGENTRGLLINFGDNDLEIWYLFYNKNKITRILMCKQPKTPLCDIIDTYDA